MNEPMVLVGSEYVPVSLTKSHASVRNGVRRVYWDDIPTALRATEEEVRRSMGARDSQWLKRVLSWNGCGRAQSFREKYLPCHHKPDETGFCKSHKASAVKDGRIVEAAS